MDSPFSTRASTTPATVGASSSADGAEHVGPDLMTGYRGHPEHGQLAPVETSRTAQHDIAQHSWQLHLPATGDQFFGEECIPGAAIEQGLDVAIVGGGAGERFDELGQLGLGEGCNVVLLRPNRPLQRNEEWPQRVAAVQFVGAVGGDQHDPLIGQPRRQEGQ